MRKLNSEFKTAFMSEAGSELANNDYFAYVELDDFACYVLASGITDFHSTQAAQKAVEHLLLTFEDHPDMNKGTLTRYLEETNKRLLGEAGTPDRLKASIMAVVTDYEKFRYLAAGNVRLRMYRQGRFHMNSADMSLANDLIDSHRSKTTILDKHEERHNLYAYLGKPEDFHPYISPKYNLKDGDIITLYSGGLWENVDSHEIDEVFAEATQEPQESIDTIEELLLSRQPQNLKSYTAAAIFINKIFRDPEREKRRARYIRIAIIVLIVLLIIAIIGYILYYRHQKKVEELQSTEAEVTDYIKTDNYVRAQASCQSVVDQAKSLGMKDDEARYRKYLMVIDGIVTGEEAFKSKDYITAFDVFMKAKDNSREADLIGMNYIEQRILQTEEYIYVGDFIALGNKALDAGDFAKAESIFYKARDKASLIHDADGRKSAMNALNSLYDKETKQKEEGEKQAKQAGEAAVNDAMKKGDELLAKGDVEGAEKEFLKARAIANANGDRTGRNDVMKSLEQVHQAKADKKAADDKLIEEKSRQTTLAADTMSKGDKAFSEGDYISAQVYYQDAMDKFIGLGDINMAGKAQTRMEEAAQKQGESTKIQTNAQQAEDEAKKLYAARDYNGARLAALKAKQIYASLDNKAKIEEINAFLTQIDMDSVIDKNLQN